MRSVATLIKVTGLYVLMPDGGIGAIAADDRVEIDAEASQAWSAHTARFLAHCMSDPTGPQRIAIIHRTDERRPWGSDTLVFDERVVRELYPVSGPTSDGLTVFQKKSRENSIYRGIELLLDYRQESIPDAPIFCPVLLERETFLSEYPSFLNRPAAAADREIPVVEVVNLLANIPIARRDVPAVRALLEKMRERLIRKDMRRAGTFTLIEKVARAARSDAGAHATFFDADKRAERQVDLATGVAGKRRIDFDKIRALPRFDQIEKWVDRNRRAPDIETLRAFAQFRDLDTDALALVAEQSRVYSAPSGTRLLERGMSDDWNMYLIEGTLALEAADGATLFVAGGSDKAANPIAFLKPRKYSVTTVTASTFLWIPNALLEALNPAPATPSVVDRRP